MKTIQALDTVSAPFQRWMGIYFGAKERVKRKQKLEL
jgi:hypothetical protein